jgi:hypothetical protein
MIRAREAFLLNAVCFAAGGLCGMAAIGITSVTALAALRFIVAALVILAASLLAIKHTDNGGKS